MYESTRTFMLKLGRLVDCSVTPSHKCLDLKSKKVNGKGITLACDRNGGQGKQILSSYAT